MKTLARTAPCLAIAVALVACQQQAPSEPAAADTDTAGAAVAASPTPTETAAPTPTPSPADEVATTIPASLQGRWGMVPADCTSTRGDAKGLLTIGPRTLRFYESVGTLTRETGRSESMIRGQFSFTGEGMEWTRDVELSAMGDTLTRLERGGDEPGGPFTYSRCS